MSKPIPVWENDWEGWTSEWCEKNGHRGMFLYCIGCGRPLRTLKEEQLQIVESVDYEMKEKDGVYEIDE